MNIYEDANIIYDAGTKAMAGSKWKYATQYFEMNHLLETAKIQKSMRESTYKPGCGQKFLISERGKLRYITSNSTVDKTVYHIVSDNVMKDALSPYIIQENTASQKGKGVSGFRKQLEDALHRYYRKHGNNDGYILITDFSGYYPNMLHEKCISQLDMFLDKSKFDTDTINTTKYILRGLFKTFEMDVSRFSDEEIERMYHEKIDPMMNVGIQKESLTGKKMLRKGVDIGTQPSQDIGIIYPYRIDNYAKIISGVDDYGRYTDDMWAISDSKEKLENLMDEIRAASKELGLIINEKKTRIVKISKPFRILQIQYWLEDTGRVVKKINPKTVTRERHKLKAYKRKYDAGDLDIETIENSFKSWIACQYKIMSKKQIKNMFKLYFSLFKRRITWKKKHSRLHWLMEQSLKDLARMETTISPQKN